MESSVDRWMTRDPVTIAPDASAVEAHALMLRRGIRHLPVVVEGSRLVGILSVDDLRAALPVGIDPRAPLPLSERAPASGWQVGELMSYAPETLAPEATLERAAERMAARRIGCLPIVDARGALVGILSETDLLLALASRLRPGNGHPVRRGASKRDPRSEPQASEGAGAASPAERVSPIEALIVELRAEQVALLAQLGRYHEEEHRLTGQLRELPTDEAERGARRDDLRLTEGLEALAARRLAAIEHALERAAQGRLGACEGCGGAIPVTRLRALPGTTRCIDCVHAGEEPAA